MKSWQSDLPNCATPTCVHFLPTSFCMICHQSFPLSVQSNIAFKHVQNTSWMHPTRCVLTTPETHIQGIIQRAQLLLPSQSISNYTFSTTPLTNPRRDLLDAIKTDVSWTHSLYPRWSVALWYFHAVENINNFRIYFTKLIYIPMLFVNLFWIFKEGALQQVWKCSWKEQRCWDWIRGYLCIRGYWEISKWCWTLSSACQAIS